MASPAAAAPSDHRARSLSEWLRRRSDEQLAGLLRRRPDLSLPAPPDLATLASRLNVRSSIQRAVDDLDAHTLRALEALVLSASDGVHPSPERARRLLPATADLDAALGKLRDLALVWGDDEQLSLLVAIPDVLGPYLAGLGRPAADLFASVPDPTLAPMLRTLGAAPAAQPASGFAVADRLEDEQRLRTLLEACDDAERDVLVRLADGPPIGRVRDAYTPGRDDTPPHRLIARGLLAPVDTQTVELPREVGVALRRSGAAAGPSPEPPTIAATERTGLDRVGSVAVLDLLRRVEMLAAAWEAAPPTVLRAGGLGIRELRRTAKAIELPETAASVVIEAAAAAGLFAPTSGLDPAFLPTPEYDHWRRCEPEGRWRQLAVAWLGMTRQPSLASQRDHNDKLIAVLSPEAERHSLPATRRHVLSVLAVLAPDSAPTDRAAVLTRLDWEAPRRASSTRPVYESVLAEAELLGITAAGGLTGYGRALLDGADPEYLLSQALPSPVDEFVVQPDLTVVVPGPPTADLARVLGQVADLESAGGAYVYRVSEATIRRALDSGQSGAALTELFASRSRTPVPQALAYLIDDATRRHGHLRTGVAASYLRCDDEDLLTRALSTLDAVTLGLRRIAPTVVVSAVAVHRLLDLLRENGFAPAAESPDGAVVSLGGDAPRAPSRPTSRLVRIRAAADSAAHLSDLVTRMRAGDQLQEVTRRVAPAVAQQVPGVTSARTLGVLRDAIRGSRQVVIDFVGDDARAARHTVLPISMAGGTLRGHEPSSSRLAAYPLHRITSVTVLDD